VPLSLGKHTRTAVPVAVYQPGEAPDAVRTYDEAAAQAGSLGALKGGDLMDLLLG
jgi:2,3-bisphosphoglycerate-independent phosphoglycerate mutase